MEERQAPAKTTDTTGAETQTTSTSTSATATPVSPLEQLAQESTTSYSKPASVSPSLTTTQVIAKETAPMATQPTMETRPTAAPTESRPVINLMLDPSVGITDIPTSSGGGGGGGFGGGSSDAKSDAKGVAKKSWLPVILIGIGAIIIVSKLIKKKSK